VREFYQKLDNADRTGVRRSGKVGLRKPISTFNGDKYKYVEYSQTRAFKEKSWFQTLKNAVDA
jgi:hypothetical protein